MNKDDFILACKYIVFWLFLMSLIWLSIKLVADGVSDYKIINPKDGIECVVVSRMFNTSVDCWIVP